MSIVDDFAKGLIGNSGLADAATKPLADIRAAVDLSVKAAVAWQKAQASIEQLLAVYGVKIEPPK